MKNEIIRGRGALRDLGPAGGSYEVDYIIHRFAKSTVNIHHEHTSHQVFTANVTSINGYTLKNGMYALDQDGDSLMLRKTGVTWELIENREKSSGAAS